jgi:hypothetical protein
VLIAQPAIKMRKLQLDGKYATLHNHRTGP